MSIHFIRRTVVACVAILLAAGAAAQNPSPAAAAAVSSQTPVVPATESWLGNLELFAGLDGSKQPQDLGINANMGVRFAANLGVALLPSAGLGAQIGGAINLSDAAVHVLDQIEGTSRRTQTYLTLGLFQRTASPLSWSLGYDLLHQRYYDTFTLHQLRGQAGVRVAANDEVGGWFTTSLGGQDGTMGGTPVRLDPITQVNGYVTHTWPTRARTTLWAGLAAHHHNIVWVLPDNSRDTNVLVYGARLELPLSDRVSITGSGNFLTPAATGTVDAYLGVTFFPGRARSAVRGRYQPALPVANNPEFPVDLRR